MRIRDYHRKRLSSDAAYAAAVRESAAVEKLADEIVDGRVRLGWTQRELASRANLTQAMVSELERGLGNPTLDTIERLRLALERGEFLKSLALYTVRWSGTVGPSFTPSDVPTFLCVDADWAAVSVANIVYAGTVTREKKEPAASGSEALSLAA